MTLKEAETLALSTLKAVMEEKVSPLHPYTHIYWYSQAIFKIGLSDTSDLLGYDVPLRIHNPYEFSEVIHEAPALPSGNSVGHKEKG